MKKIVMIGASIAATVLLLSACALLPAQTEQAPEVAATEAPTAEAPAAEVTTAPEATFSEFSLTTLTGETLDQTVISDNKLIMVNYWATWCGPCVGEIPDLVKISKAYADKGFVLIGVLTGDDDIDGARTYIADQQVTYPNVLPEGPFLSYATNIYAIPTTLFFDSTGKQIGEAVVGAKSYDDWAGLIDLLLTQVS
jgi:thiol-disulfide isomerase/thioredoxin